MSEDEIIWTIIFNPHYQIYEHRLISFISESWPISLNENESTLAKAGLFYTANGAIVHFVVFIFIDGYTR